MAPSADRPDPFLIAYRTLRRAMLEGDLAPGDQIVVTDIARQLRISATPVREALSRLAGERLVEDHRHHGYCVPLPSAVALIEQFSMVQTLLLAALMAPRSAPIEPAAEAVADLRSLYLAILALSPNQSLRADGRYYLEALNYALRREALLFDVAPQLLDLANASDAADRTAQIRAVRRLHRMHRSHADAVAHDLATSHRAKISTI